MSEVYNFKPLSEVDPLNEPTSSTNILAVESGKVKQIPASAIGGGGAGNFIVNVALNVDDFSASGDKTFVEMKAAIESGALPVVAIDLSVVGEGFVYGSIANYLPDEGLVFVAFTVEAYLSVICLADDTWQVHIPE